MTTTVSKVMLQVQDAEPERVMLRKWCEWAASNGGSFAVKQDYTDGKWWTEYTINWPDDAATGAAK